MARTTAANVQKIISHDSAITDLDPFIDTANELVTEICGDSGYTDTRLELIERWLAAHFLAIRDPRYESKKIGSAQGKYRSKVDFNLSLTHYGQQAQMLDTAGGLSTLSKRPRESSVTWLGEEDEYHA